MPHLYCLLLSILCLQTAAFSQPSAAADPAETWNHLRTERQALKSFHQEFEVSRTFRTGQHTQASKASLVVDAVAARWRQRSISGVADRVTIFDGKDRFEFNGDADGNEYVRLKSSSKEELPQPDPYSAAHLNFSKAVERERQSCALANVDHQCVTIDIPVKPWMRSSGDNSVKIMNGVTRVVFDSVTGLLILSRTVEVIDNGHEDYQSDTTYILKRMSYNGPANELLFRVPPAAKEVKELTKWNADKIKKQLAGKPAPSLVLSDMQGKTIKLTDLKGKTVLLDFWATWCGPCREDGPSLDKLYQKYGGNNLAIVGISVDEERSVVQNFLSEHAHKYTIALTTENEMPEAYRIGVFPTYIVIDSEGNLVSATEGEKGFSELRRLLKKAGLDTE